MVIGVCIRRHISDILESREKAHVEAGLHTGVDGTVVARRHDLWSI